MKVFPYIPKSNKVIGIVVGDIISLKSFEQDMNEAYGEDSWSYDEEELLIDKAELLMGGSQS